MSTTRLPHSCRVLLAGVFFILLLQIAIAVHAVEIEDVCLTGFSPPPKPLVEENSHVLNSEGENPQILLHPVIQQWLKENSWPTGYALWQQARQCSTALLPSFACTVKNAPVPSEGKCGGEMDGYQFLVMHRYLLQTFKTLWPELDKQFASWKKFPAIADYPEAIEQQIYAWPDAVLQAASAVAKISKANSTEVLQRWPTEGAFGQWLQCGGAKGMGVDALYGALLSNAITIPSDQLQLLDLYLFWRTHAWIDSAWEKYRRAIGKMPDEPPLQAALIQQCRVHQFWTQQTAPAGAIHSLHQTLYQNGYLNPAYTGKLARIQAEVEEIHTDGYGHHYVRVNPHLVGVNAIWVASDTPLHVGPVKIGGRYTFIGEVKAGIHLPLPEAVRSPALLLLQSIQTIK